MGTPVQHRPALHWEGEEGITRTMTYEELRREVNRCANGLRRYGHRPRRSRRAVHADVPRAGRSVLRRHQCWRNRAALVLWVWCRCGRQPIAGLRREGPVHCRWFLATRTDCADEGHCRSGHCSLTVGAARDRRVASRRRDLDDWPRLPLVRSRWLRVRRVRAGADRRRRADDDHLHVGHNRASEGRRTFALRLPHQKSRRTWSTASMFSQARRCTG
jgi:hypothetical protein